MKVMGNWAWSSNEYKSMIIAKWEKRIQSMEKKKIRKEVKMGKRRAGLRREKKAKMRDKTNRERQSRK